MKMKLNERTVIKYKYDPLAVIEAKFAMTQGKGDGVSSDPVSDKGNKSPTEGNTAAKPQNVKLPTQPSPGVGTQEPATEWSSQEDNMEMNNDGKETLIEKVEGKHQSPNWEAMEEESDKESHDITTRVTEEGCEEEDVAGDDDLTQEEKTTRQSQRIKEQGRGQSR
jgi:hypothetical protein